MFVTATPPFGEGASAAYVLLNDRPLPSEVANGTVFMKVASTKMCRPLHEWLTGTLTYDEERCEYAFDYYTICNFRDICGVLWNRAACNREFPDAPDIEELQNVGMSMDAQLTLMLTWIPSSWDFYYHGV